MSIKINSKIFNNEYKKYIDELMKIGNKYKLPVEIEQYSKERKYITKLFVKRVLYKSIEYNIKQEVKNGNTEQT